jgi:rod shape-determining protein MreB
MTATVPTPPASSDETPTPGSGRNGGAYRPRRRLFRPATDFAIDLGTANTLILAKGEGVVLNEPTVAAVNDKGQVTAIGLEAKRMLGRTPDGIRPVRPLKDGVIADFTVAEQLIRGFLRRVLDQSILRVKPTLVICVPSIITEVERRAVRDAGQAAGAKAVYMVSEPMAAAIGAGLPVDTPRGSMVVDIGGGTTDVAVIALSGIVADASIRAAGDELDAAIVAYMRRTFSLLIGEATSEMIKMRIGSAVPLEEELSMPVKGRDLVSGLPRTVTVDSTGVRDALQETISRIVNAVRRALEVTPPELASDLTDFGIVLTGGGAMLRGLDVLLSAETGLPVHIDPDPLTSVVRGTGLILDDIKRWRGVLTT